MSGWLRVRHGKAPLIVSLPHTGTDIPPTIEAQLRDPWLSRKDADWWIDRLYDFAEELDATIVHTAISRTVIDVNRDPSGASLYPGQSTTGLCPATTFDGEPLYLESEPDDAEVNQRRETFFAPYHAALAAEIERLRQSHGQIVLYDCHSIRSRIPRLFDGLLPAMNIGTNSGASCDSLLARTIERIAAGSRFDHVVNGRFKGGWITRQYGKPERGVHAVQMELACRSYMQEPDGAVDPDNWPGRYDAAVAAPMRETLRQILTACSNFSPAKQA
jgi:N-formylglutamate deformylase